MNNWGQIRYLRYHIVLYIYFNVGYCYDCNCKNINSFFESFRNTVSGLQDQTSTHIIVISYFTHFHSLHGTKTMILLFWLESWSFNRCSELQLFFLLTNIMNFHHKYFITSEIEKLLEFIYQWLHQNGMISDQRWHMKLQHDIITKILCTFFIFQDLEWFYTFHVDRKRTECYRDREGPVTVL